MPINNIDELFSSFDDIEKKLATERDRLEELIDNATDLLGNCNEALDSIEWARECLSRTL